MWAIKTFYILFGKKKKNKGRKFDSKNITETMVWTASRISFCTWLSSNNYNTSLNICPGEEKINRTCT